MLIYFSDSKNTMKQKSIMAEMFGAHILSFTILTICMSLVVHITKSQHSVPVR